MASADADFIAVCCVAPMAAIMVAPTKTPTLRREQLPVVSADAAPSKKARLQSPVMKIFVSLPTGKTITLDVRGEDNGMSVRTKIRSKEGYPLWQQRLVFEGKELMADHLLSAHNIQGGAVLRLDCGWQIYVRLSATGQTHIIEVDGSEFVGVVTSIIQTTVGIPAAQQQLMFNGITLQDGTTLADHDINKLATLHIMG